MDADGERWNDYIQPRRSGAHFVKLALNQDAMEQARRSWNWRATLRWLRVRDIIVLVAGILIAFALDAWWQTRGVTGRERAHLTALAHDFEQNIARLDELIELEDRIAESSRDLLLMDLPTRADPDSIRRLIGLIYTSNRFEPVMGTYRALETSGGLAQLRDDSLRHALGVFASQLEVRYYERFSDEVYLAFVRDFVGEIALFEPYVVGGSISVTGDSDVLRSPRFREYIALRHVAARDVAHEYRRLRLQAEIVSDRLQRLVR
jgi:hypothetical protein